MSEDIEFDKCVGQYRMALHGVLKPLRMYGQNQYVDTVTEELVSLALQLHFKLYGVDMPYHVNGELLHW